MERADPAPSGGITLRHVALHASAQLVVEDVVCHARGAGCGPEEVSSSDQLVFPTRGMFVRHVGRDEVLGAPSRVLLFRAGEPYRVSHPASCGDACATFTFAPTLLREAVRLHDPAAAEHTGSLLARADASCPPRAWLLAQRLVQAARARAASLALDEAALALLAVVLAEAYRTRPVSRDGRRADTRARHRAQVDGVARLLAVRFAEELPLDALARAVHASPFHLARLFRRETGLSLHQYRLRLRLHAGLARVVDGERDLTQLALTSGFSSHAHFTDTFRRAFGVAPSACRRVLTARQLRELSKNLEVPLVRAP